MRIPLHKTFLLATLVCLISHQLPASKRYWISAVTASWNSTANWSSSSGGSSGASVPGSNDTAYFDGSGLGRCDINATVNVKRFEMKSTYTDTVTQNSNTITVGSTGMILDGGVFIGSSSAITVNGNYNNSACKFTSTSGTLQVGGDFKITGTGTFTHNSGTVKLPFLSSFATVTASCSTSSSTKNLYDLILDASTFKTINITSTDTFHVAHNLSTSGSAALTTQSGVIEVKGDITTSSTYTGNFGSGSTQILLNGSGTQHIYGSSAYNKGFLPKLKISKSSSDSMIFSGFVCVKNDFSYSSGLLRWGTSKLVLAQPLTVTGKFTLPVLLVAPTHSATATYAINSTDTITVTDTLRYDATQGIIINSGLINLKGDFIVANTSTSFNLGGSTTILFSGNARQNFQGSSTYYISYLPNIKIDKSGDTLHLKNTININGDWTYANGNIDAGTSTVAPFGNHTFTGNHELYNLTFPGFFTYTNTIASGTTLTVKGTLSMMGANPITTNIGTIAVKGDIVSTNTSTSTSSGGSATILVNGTGDQTLTGSGVIGTGFFPKITINKSSGTLHLASIISANNDWTYTAGIVDSTAGTVSLHGSHTITGSHKLYNVTIPGGGTTTIASGTTLTTKGTLRIQGTGSVILNTGTIEAKGDILAVNTSTVTTAGGSATILISGGSSQLFTGGHTAAVGFLPKVTINKTGGVLVIDSVINVNNDWTYTAGTVTNRDSSTVYFFGTHNIDGQGTSATMPFGSVIFGGTSTTSTLTGNLRVGRSLTVNSSKTFAQGNFDLNLGKSWTNNGTWTVGTGTVTFDGSSNGTISKASNAAETFPKLVLNKSGTGVINHTNSLVVSTSLNLTRGAFKSTTDSLITINSGVTVTGGSDSAYIDGRLKKVGNAAFTFPLGSTALPAYPYHPLTITAPSSGTDAFTAKYIFGAQAYGSTLSDSLRSINPEEYFVLTRSAGTSNVKATLSWNVNSTFIHPGDSLLIAHYNPSDAKWHPLGGANFFFGGTHGRYTTSVPVNFSGGSTAPLLFSIAPWFPGFATLKRKLEGDYHMAWNGVLRFKYDEEYADKDNKLSYTIYDNNHRPVVTSSTASTKALPVVYGDNRYAIDLTACNFLHPGAITPGYYLLEVINEKNEKWLLRFYCDYNTSSVNCTD